jgi:STE24 endopeptidase
MAARLRDFAIASMILLVFAAPLRASVLRGLEGPTPSEAAALAQAEHDHTAYTLPPEKLAKAQALHRIEDTLAVSGTLWTPLQLLLLLVTGAAAWMRNTAERIVRRRWLQVVTLASLLVGVHALLTLPIRMYAHHVSLVYGLSVERWLPWCADVAKGFVLTALVGTLAGLLVFGSLHRSPRRWWLWMWPIAVALVLAGLLVTPYLIDPLFNRFEPLAASDPALVTQLERVVERSGMAIPPDRMFLMNASEKYTGMNAYVTGFGPSKRIVVWDTTIAHSSPDEIAFVFAHELGHYALGHVFTGTALSCLGLLPLFWLTHLGAGMLIRRWGEAWRLRSDEWSRDLAAGVVLLLVAMVLSAVSDPIGNAVSRRMEHNADVYGQEAVRGIVVDPQGVGVKSFQELGETSLEDPAPHPVLDAWFGTHPPIWLRSAFTKVYDPWAAGGAPKYFPR